jgi:predicted nuclease of predicted toxin-antitoxin system
VKLLLDENLSPRLSGSLSDLYPECVHVREVGLATASDDIVWQFAAEHGYVIVTKDADFNHRAFLLGAPPKVIWLRVGNACTADVAERLRRHGSEIAEFLQDEAAALLAIQ